MSASSHMQISTGIFCLSSGIIRKFALFVIDTEAAEKMMACQAESLYAAGSSKT
jgi:hypothetical protein